MKRIVLSGICFFLGAFILQAQVVTINTANGTTGNAPMGSSTYHISEHIFLQTEMGVPAGTAIPITFMKFNIATLVGTPTTFSNVAIYAKTTTASVFASSSTYAGTAGFTLLYSGAVSFTTTGLGGVNIAPGTYTYPNTTGNNLDIMIVRTNSSGNAGHVFNAALGNATAGTTALTSRRYNSTIAPVAGTSALTGSAFRTCIQFGTALNNDASVQGVYTLGKMPIEYGAPTIIQANIKNNGLNTLTNLPVTLNISGTNGFSDVQTIATLAPGASAVVNFANYSPASLSTNDVVTVTLPNDDLNANNSGTWNMQITPNVYTYKNTSQANAGGVGFTGATGDFVAKFNSNPGINWPYQNAPKINEIKVDFTSAGNPYNLGIWDATGVGGTPGNLLWTSPNLTSAVGTAVIPVPDVPVSGDYFVGVKQTGTTNIAFAYQAENPIRPQTFYYTSPTGNTSWTDFSATNSAFRFAIEVSVHIPVPPNCAINFEPMDGVTKLCQNPTLSWGNGGGGPTGYDVYLSTDINDIINLNASYLVSGNQPGTSYTPSPALLANTTYYWTVIPKNTDGDAINCGTHSFTTGILTNCYCNPVHSTQCTGVITNVSLNTLSNSTTCAAPGFNAYPTLSTTLQQNSTYTLSVTTNQSDIVSMWIDYNQNGNFDASEWQQVTTASTANSPSTLSFSIPSTSLTGQTAMRIRSRFTANVNGSGDACTAMGSGESEDYVITIVPEPPCSGTPAPGNTIASVSTACSGSIVNLSVQSPVSGVGITYQWQSADDAGFTTNVQNLGTAITQAATLTANTNYRCVVTCTNSSGVGYSTPVLVTLNTDPCACNAYCAPTTPNTCDETITNVTFAGINQNSGCNYPYVFFNATGAVTAGQSYTLSYTIAPYYTSDQVNVFFDWNHDGDFDDAGETYSTSNTASGSGTIAVPATATPGNTRMRVRLAWAQVPTACGSNGYSEAEDYCVTVSPGTATLNLKCYIEGYYIGSGMMTSVLNNSGLSNPTTDCDTVTVELHDATTPYAMAYSYTGVLQTNGTISCTFPPASLGNSYYLVVNHRNAMQTWSANPITISSVTSYDFSTNGTQAYGGNQANVGAGVYAFYSGDINQDFSIDAFDYLVMDPDIYNGAGGYLDTDLNGDGSVDAFDYLIYDPNGYNGITIQSP